MPLQGKPRGLKYPEATGKPLRIPECKVRSELVFRMANLAAQQGRYLVEQIQKQIQKTQKQIQKKSSI